VELIEEYIHFKLSTYKIGMKKTTYLLLLAIMLGFSYTQAQNQKPPSEYGGGLKVALSEDGQKYFRLITWHQFWLDLRNTSDPITGEDKFTATPMLRRSRMLLYAQLSERFLILTHFGLNNLTPGGMDPLGYSPQAQLFMHDAWVEFKVNENLFLGGGLHYWNGISRLNNQSTLNFLPLDNPRHAWATIGTTDQFARHLGVYAKGDFGKFNYRVAWNGAMVNSLDANNGLDGTSAQADYIGRKVLGPQAANIFAGYFNYQVFDQESTKLPYFVGSYLGTKKILSIGAGFYNHANGSIRNLTFTTDGQGNQIIDTYDADNVLIWAVDVFTELPLAGNNGAVTGYLQFQNSDYGENYQLNRTSQSVFTGNVIYFQGGFLFPHKGAFAWQPYLTVTNNSIDALDGNGTDFGIGLNSLITGHHAKLSLEYRSMNPVVGDSSGRVILQAVVFL
jgi:hypothetical protein